MRRIPMFLATVALAVLAVASVSAQTDTPATDQNRDTMTDTNMNSTTVMGKVVSTSGRTLVIETDAGNRMTFEMDTSSLPAGTSTGSRVQVAYSPSQTGGVNHASSVTMTSATGTATADVNNRYRDTATGGSTTSARTDTTHPMTGANDTDADRNNANANTYASNRNLPATASSMPLVGLLGLVALGGALGVAVLRRVF